MSNQIDYRDRTIFVEHFPGFRLISCWYENGKLDYFEADERYGNTYATA